MGAVRGDTVEVPRFDGKRGTWKVKVLGHSTNYHVRWLTGPLKGKEARLATLTGEVKIDGSKTKKGRSKTRRRKRRGTRRRSRTARATG